MAEVSSSSGSSPPRIPPSPDALPEDGRDAAAAAVPTEEAAAPEADGEDDIIVWPRDLLLELLVVLLVALIPNLFYSFASLVLPEPTTPLPFAYVYLSGLIQGVVPAALVLFVIHKSGEARESFGLVRPRLRDLALGPAIWWVDLLLFGAVLAPFLERFAAPETFEALEARLLVWFPRPEAPWHHALLAAECCAIGFGEEILFRGYLIPRVSRVLRSEGAGLVVSAAIFGFCHAYQGVLGVASTVSWGLVFGAFFLVVPRIWPLALAHALNNFLFFVW